MTSAYPLRHAVSLALAVALIASSRADASPGFTTEPPAALASRGTMIDTDSPTAIMAATGQASMASPTRTVTVLRLASIPLPNWKSGHRGLDLKAPSGEIVAPAAGTVSFVGWVVDRPVVSIVHANGLVTSLEPVTAEVVKGQKVRQGERVGTVDPTAAHCPKATCVHWGLRLNGNYVNPLDYLEGFGPVKLLPWWRD